MIQNIKHYIGTIWRYRQNRENHVLLIWWWWMRQALALIQYHLGAPVNSTQLGKSSIQSRLIICLNDKQLKQLKCQKVRDSRVDTSPKIILESVQPGSIIYSYCWRGYNLTGLEYDHHNVNNSPNFLNPYKDRSIHTQSVESQCRPKPKMTWDDVWQNWTRGVMYESFLIEWIRRSCFNEIIDLFNDFCQACRYIRVRAYDYPPPNALQVISSWSPSTKKVASHTRSQFWPSPQPTKVIRSVSDSLPTYDFSFKKYLFYY